jgi:flagellar biosynthesis component FlhA
MLPYTHHPTQLHTTLLRIAAIVTSEEFYMGNQIPRMIATGIIWAAITAIMMTMMITQSDLNFIIVAILAGAAWFATDTVWSSGKNEAKAAQEESEKAKRQTKVERLVDTLSQQELNELRSRLVADSDGELVSLDDVLSEQRRQSR